MSYDVTLTGAYQTAVKSADALTVAFVANGFFKNTDAAKAFHTNVRREVFEDLKVVAGPEAQAAAARPQSGGRSGGGSRGGGQSSIPTDGSTTFGKMNDDGTASGGAVGPANSGKTDAQGQPRGFTIAEVDALTGEQMQSLGIGDGSKTGRAYLKGLLEFEGYKNDYMKRRIKAYFDNLNNPVQPQTAAAESAPAPTVEPDGKLDEDFKFPEE